MKFSFTGEFYTIEKVTFLPKPVQQPRIKIWGAGNWPHKGPFKRAAKLDGIIPLSALGRELSQEELKQIIEFVKSHGGIQENFDFARIYFDRGEDFQIELDKFKEFREIGVTWWLKGVSYWAEDTECIIKEIKEGPPKI